ncbi:carboxypeptidase-like regulatory domain-containing protein [Pedobacter namyangjuensis]|uniref:carboxypeptidase-like regulatory domain-containing protein n=1 Tax=Pedobacter namyangjuensis TaxID=600626 RepID=UPI000DE2781D|nr:carboxypeptidase-like regulatory domain-containing protein [Pedobacter namyangjuensis]
MKTKAISVQIAEPCTQNWELMEDRSKGRFCEACQKCVVDFSNHSNAEIVKIIASSNESICGRLSVTQLNQLNYYFIAAPSNKNWLKYLSVLAIGASLFVNEAKAIGISEPIEIVSGSEKAPIDVKPNKLKKIYGYVFDENNKPLAGIRVVIANTKLFSKTDENGRYEIVFKNSLVNENSIIKVESIRFEGSTKLNYLKEKQVDLKLAEVYMIMGKIAMVNKT